MRLLITRCVFFLCEGYFLFRPTVSRVVIFYLGRIECEGQLQCRVGSAKIHHPSSPSKEEVHLFLVLDQRQVQALRTGDGRMVCPERRSLRLTQPRKVDEYNLRYNRTLSSSISLQTCYSILGNLIYCCIFYYLCLCCRLSYFLVTFPFCVAQMSI